MRTYTLESVEKKIFNCRQFISRAKRKENLLASLLKIREDLLSPENEQKNLDRVEKMKKDIARMEASIERAKEEKELRENLEKAFPAEEPASGIGAKFLND